MPSISSQRRYFNGIASKRDLPVSGQNRRTALHMHVENGDLTAVKDLLTRMRANPNQTDIDAQTALHMAMSARDLEMVGLLLDHGARFDCVDGMNNTPVSLAMEKECSLDFFKAIYAMADIISAVDSDGACILHRAAAAGRADIVSFILSKGLPIDVRDKLDRTSLLHATENKQHEAMRVLLSAGANPVAENRFLSTPAHVAANHGDKDGLEILLSDARVCRNLNGTRTFIEEYTPLLGAVQQGHAALIPILVAAGADPNASDAAGHSAVHIAAREGYVNVLQALADSGADVAKPLPNLTGMYPIHDIGDHDYSGVLEFLCTRGADINARDKDGRTALYIKVAGNVISSLADSEHIRMLLEAGADPNIPCNSGYRALEFACENRMDKAIIDLLLKHGADPNLEPTGVLDASPIFFALRSSSEELAIKLIAAGADVHLEERNAAKMRPILVAASSGLRDAARALLRAGADPTVVSSVSQNVLHHAAGRMSPEMLKMFLEMPEVRKYIDAQDHRQETPLHHAAAQNVRPDGKAPCVAALLDAGAHPWIHDHNGLTPLMRAIGDGNENVMQAYIAGVPNIDWNAKVPVSGARYLHYAASRNSEKIVKELFRLGADATLRDAKGWTPLHSATAAGYGSMVMTLLIHLMEREVDVSELIDNAGRSPLHVAAEMGASAEIVRHMLEAHVPIDQRVEETGDTPLMIASRSGNFAAVVELLNSGANLHLKNKAGETAMSLADKDSVRLAFSKWATMTKAAKPGMAP